jgi:hypothetical protein
VRTDARARRSGHVTGLRMRHCLNHLLGLQVLLCGQMPPIQKMDGNLGRVSSLPPSRDLQHPATRPLILASVCKSHAGSALRFFPPFSDSCDSLYGRTCITPRASALSAGQRRTPRALLQQYRQGDGAESAEKFENSVAGPELPEKNGRHRYVEGSTFFWAPGLA